MDQEPLDQGVDAATQRSAGDGLPIGLLIRLALAGLLIAAVVVFVLQNLDSVPVNFLSWGFDAPLIVLLAVAAVAGVLVRWVVGFWWARRSS